MNGMRFQRHEGVWLVDYRVTCHWVPGSLSPRFIVSRVHCVPGCMCLQLLCNIFLQLFATFMQLFLQLPPPQLFATFLPKKIATFCIFWQLVLQLQKNCKKVAKKVTKKVAKRVATNLQKVAKKSCIKLANTENPGRNEPGTQ